MSTTIAVEVVKLDDTFTAIKSNFRALLEEVSRLSSELAVANQQLQATSAALKDLTEKSNKPNIKRNKR